jgi:hypothetical protein
MEIIGIIEIMGAIELLLKKKEFLTTASNTCIAAAFGWAGSAVLLKMFIVS